MTPALISDSVSNSAGPDVVDKGAPTKPTSILHRTSWNPPVAVSANGIYIQLKDGTTLIDGVGGASVACIGNGHPEVIKAVKEQVDRMACTSRSFHPVDVGISDRCDKMCTTCSCRVSLRSNLHKSWYRPEMEHSISAGSPLEAQRQWKVSSSLHVR